MSLLGKEWIIQNQDGGLDVVAKLLKNRNLDTEEKRRSFFEDGLENLHDPFLFRDIEKAAERIRRAIDGKEKIMIFGDYDVDGITSTVIIYDFLKNVGADVYYTLPNREKDGYGLKDYFIRRFKDDGVKLTITVDCGTANLNEVKLANEIGMEVIITDHHDVPEELPPAYAIINPRQKDCEYPNKDISGSGVAYKLVSVLAPYYFDADHMNRYLRHQLGIMVLGLVSDCMPLTGENRILTKHGLISLETGDYPGVRALMENAGIAGRKVTSITIGFYLGPRINAAGRLDTPYHAFELLLGNAEKVSTLSMLNSRRQKMVEEFVREAKSKIADMGEMPDIIVISSPDWHVGTLGLIAGKICDCFYRPAIAMKEKDGEFVASVRSLNGFDITSFLRKETGDLFTAFGGHKLAGGFTLPKKNLDDFLRRVNSASKKYIDPDKFHDVLEIDCEIMPHELTNETSKRITELEPFGNGNPEPTLMIKNVKISGIKPVGGKSEHLQFPVEYGGKKVQAIAFRFGEHLDKINPGSEYDVAFKLEINEWNGYKKLQLRVVDLKQSN
jgi:single-stranded-DNA-specific exonuclease